MASNSAQGGEAEASVEDTQRLLHAQYNSSLRALEVSHRRQGHYELPSLTTRVAALVALVLVCLCTALLVFGPSGDPFGTGDSLGQLPAACKPVAAGPFWDWLEPKHYNLSLTLPPPLFQVDPGSLESGASPGEFNATVAIQFEVREPTPCVLLHASGMRFWHASLAAAEGGPQQAERAERTLCSSAEECKVMVAALSPAARSQRSTLDQDLVAVDLRGAQLQKGATAVLRLRYTGTLALDGEGLYRSDAFVTCREEASAAAGGGGGACRASVLLVTQLELLSARRLLPCYDGPRFKARFTVTLEVPSGMVALSNMPQTGRAPAASAGHSEAGGAGAMDLVTFEPTPLMSPYLLALAVGELRQLEVADDQAEGSEPLVRLWAVPVRGQQLRVAQAAATGALRFFREWTGVAQPLRKFDMVAVPGKAGAMENWGLLLFDEDRFLVNEATEGAYGAWLAGDVACHEIAHQWFGNLVTTPDWTQMTVNEGVASFMEYKCLEAALPLMPARPLFARAASPSGERLGIHEGPVQRALGYLGDPLLLPLLPPSELDPRDGVVVYSKGASLLGMIEAFFEARQPGAFKAGFRAFLQRHMNGTVTMADLLAALAAQVSPAAGSSPAAPPNDADLAGFAQLSQQYGQQFSSTPLGSPFARHATSAGANAAALSSNPLAAWLHWPGYPYLTFEGGPAVQNGSAAPIEWAAAAVQHPFCSWVPERPPSQPGSAGGPGGGGAATTCSLPGGARWWLPLSASGPSVSSGSIDELWVADPAGTGLYRTAYPEPYLQTLLAAVGALGPCYRATGSDGSRSSGCGAIAAGAAAAAAVPIGSSSCGSLNTSSCELDGRPLLAAASVVSDTIALAFVGVYPAIRALEAAQAAAQAPISATGAGAYLLLLPAVEALQDLRPLAAANSSRCLQRLDAVAAKLLAPYAARAVQGTLPGAAAMAAAAVDAAQREQQRSQQDAFLGQLAASPLAWHAALMGDAATSAALCGALPATPLWRHISAALSAASGGAQLGCPPGFQQVAPANSSSSGNRDGAPLCQRDGTSSGSEGVPGGLGPGDSSPSPDLLPAVYIAAGAGAPGCAPVLQQYGVTPAAVSRGLSRCWEQEVDWAEASRCLHALPFASEEGGALEEALGWLLRYPSNCSDNSSPKAEAGGSSTERLPLELAVRAANRRRALPSLLPTLLRNAAARGTAAWRRVVQSVGGGWRRSAGCGLLGPLCAMLEQLPAPWTSQDSGVLAELISGLGNRPGLGCSAAARSRVLGRAVQAQRLAAASGPGLCELLGQA